MAVHAFLTTTSLSLLQAGLNPSGEGSATRFSVSTRLYSPRPSGRPASPPCCTLRRRSTFFSVFPTPLSTYVCLQDSPDTILLFSALHMPKPSQPGLPYFVRDARYSEDAGDIVIHFLVFQREAKNPS